MKFLLLLGSLPAILGIFGTGHILASQAQDTSNMLQVTRHFVTQRPNSDMVMVERQNECTGMVGSSCLECEGQLNGNYTWTKENSQANYVAFELNQRADVTRIRLNYAVVSSTSQTPKVSFCVLPTAITIPINITLFSNLNCRKVNIQPSTGYAIQTITMEMPFDQDTENVAMEVITRGIKASFVATGVQFFGNYTTVTTPTTTTTTSATTTASTRGTRTGSKPPSTQMVTTSNSVTTTQDSENSLTESRSSNGITISPLWSKYIMLCLVLTSLLATLSITHYN